MLVGWMGAEEPVSPPKRGDSSKRGKLTPTSMSKTKEEQEPQKKKAGEKVLRCHAVETSKSYSQRWQKRKQFAQSREGEGAILKRRGERDSAGPRGILKHPCSKKREKVEVAKGKTQIKKHTFYLGDDGVGLSFSGEEGVTPGREVT